MATILLIEDDPLTRQAVERILTARGHEVVSAINGVDGLDRFASRTFDLLITDLIMSYSGLTTIKTVRLARPDLGILAISGSTTHLDAARQLGADQVLLKPISAEGLTRAVDSLVNADEGVSP